MIEPKPQRIGSWVAITIGLAITALCGTCTFSFAFPSRGQAGTFLIPLVIGGIPTGVGLALAISGILGLRRIAADAKARKTDDGA